MKGKVLGLSLTEVMIKINTIDTDRVTAKKKTILSLYISSRPLGSKPASKGDWAFPVFVSKSLAPLQSWVFNHS